MSMSTQLLYCQRQLEHAVGVLCNDGHMRHEESIPTQHHTASITELKSKSPGYLEVKWVPPSHDHNVISQQQT